MRHRAQCQGKYSQLLEELRAAVQRLHDAYWLSRRKLDAAREEEGLDDDAYVQERRWLDAGMEKALDGVLESDRPAEALVRLAVERACEGGDGSG